MENLEIYNALRAVDKTATKSFSNGRFSGTDVNPMWRIKKLTETFGPCGIGWYTEVVREWTQEAKDKTMCFVDINLYVKVAGEWSKPIFGTGGNSLSQLGDEGYKGAYTDAISVACKALGMCADIYYEKDASSKYAQYYTDGKQQEAQPSAPAAPVKKAVTMGHYEKGQCANLIAELARYNHENLQEWKAGKNAIKFRKNADGVIVSELSIPDDVMAKIEEAAKAMREAR